MHACDNVKQLQQAMDALQPPATATSASDEDEVFSPPTTPRASFDVISGITEGSLRDTQVGT